MNLTVKSKSSVLIADSKDATRQSLRQCLLQVVSDLMIIESKDGLDALAKISRQKFDLVIMETALPKLDGNQLMSKLKGSPREFIPKRILVYSNLVPENSVANRDAFISYLNPSKDEKLLKDYLQSVFQKTIPTSAAFDAPFVNMVFSEFKMRFRELTGVVLGSGRVSLITDQPLKGEVAGVVDFTLGESEGRLLVSFLGSVYSEILKKISSNPETKKPDYDFTQNLITRTAMSASRQTSANGHHLAPKKAQTLKGQNGIIGNWNDMTRLGTSFGSDLGPQTCFLELQIRKFK
jgi:CheY-like chemotaxis protein